MLIVQHIWSRWTKAARGANAPLQRPRLDEAYALPQEPYVSPPAGGALLHDIRALEREDFAIDPSFAPVTRREWKEAQWSHGALLDWHVGAQGVGIILQSDTSRRQTKWPAFLPSPLFTLREGETARIDWNGRFRTSMGGSNRSSYYEQHCYWLALAGDPAPRLFLDAAPRKHIDLRTEIY
jgi:hypothetical protein